MATLYSSYTAQGLGWVLKQLLGTWDSPPRTGGLVLDTHRGVWHLGSRGKVPDGASSFRPGSKEDQELLLHQREACLGHLPLTSGLVEASVPCLLNP